jgi:hypothetical protein
MEHAAAEAIAAQGLLSLSKSDGESQSTNDARPGVQHQPTGTYTVSSEFLLTLFMLLSVALRYSLAIVRARHWSPRRVVREHASTGKDNM